MKKSNLLTAGAVILALGLSSCSSDEPSGGEIAEKDDVRYLTVNIVNAPGSRAATFEDGTAEENAVATNQIIFDFYDIDGKFVSRSNPSDITWSDNTAETTPNVGRIGTAVVKVDVTNGQKYPSYVMCYLNPVDYATPNPNDNMNALRIKTRSNYKNGTYFAMNNSCYYGTDPLTGQTDVKMTGAPIDEKKLFLTFDEANNQTNNDYILDIYVERYAAKVKFTMTPSGIEDYKGQKGKEGAFTLKFTPEAWTINADEPEMYAVKNFSDTKDGLTNPETPATYANVNTMLSGWNDWNDAGNFRSYWACSPAYFADDYPQVADQIADRVTDGTGAGQAVTPYMLKYYSYNQITGDGANAGNKNFVAYNENGKSVTPYRYALENTMGTKAFTSGNPQAAVPAVLVVGKYKVTYGTTELPEKTTFYLFNDNIYFANTVNEIENTPLILNALLSQNNTLATKSTVDGVDTYTKFKEATEALTAVMTVEHPSKAVREYNVNKIVPHRYVTLQLKEAPTGANTLYFNPTGKDDGWTAITASNLTQANRMLWEQVGQADVYTDGMCYYSIPVRHLGFTENTPAADKPLANKNETTGQETYNWSNLRTGDMGLVRNHVYDLEVSAVKGLATGINDADYPIVPPRAVTSYYVKYRINILNWRIVPKQTIIL